MRSLKTAFDANPHQLVILAFATIISVISYGFFLSKGLTVLYTDEISHLMISRRVVDNLSGSISFGQLGNVWLPLPHILMLPIIWIDPLYHTGAAGSFISMLSFIVSVVFLYKIGTLVTDGDRWASLLATLFVFGINPNVLYMQSTAMTESLLLATLLAATYYLLQFAQTHHDDITKSVILMRAIGIAVFLGILTRYESWAFVVGLGGIILYIFLRNRYSWSKSEAFTIFFSLFAFFGIGLWVFWNWTIFGEPLGFAFGEYAKPSNWVSERDIANGNFLVSLLTYTIATIHMVSPPVFLIGTAGFVFFVIKTKLHPHYVGALTLFVVFPFYVLMLYTGFRPMHIAEITGDLYNTRFTFPMVAAITIVAAFLMRQNVWAKTLISTSAILGALFLISSNNVVTLNESLAFSKASPTKLQEQAADWFRQNYTDGFVLIEGFGNETFQYHSRLALQFLNYEGNFKEWEPALVNPSDEVDWIFMRKSPGNPDKVWTTFQTYPDRLQGFTPVYDDGQQIEIYHKINPTLVQSTVPTAIHINPPVQQEKPVKEETPALTATPTVQPTVALAQHFPVEQQLQKEEELLAIAALDTTPQPIQHAVAWIPTVTVEPTVSLLSHEILSPTATPQPEEMKQEEQPSFYTVSWGDRLADIAYKMYGNYWSWRVIFDANREKIQDPNRIYPGQELIVPRLAPE